MSDPAATLLFAAVAVLTYGFPILILVMIVQAWRRSQARARVRDASIVRIHARLDGLEGDVAEILGRLGPARH